ncbi:hypothetical protein [Streptomyces sp. NPDC017448]|uniref:hypothetical protein n=1 Tax=Streptomyces sp. NPDC017448 TaxID=3364996 RepID=UPI00378A9099
MDSISLDWEAAVSDPGGAVEKLKQLQEEVAEFSVRVGIVIMKLEALEGRPCTFPGQAGPPPSGGSASGGQAHETPRGPFVPPQAGRGDDLSGRRGGGAGEVRLTRRMQVLALVEGSGDRAWNVREIGEAIAQPNLRSLRVLVEELAQQGCLARRSVPPRSVLYSRASSTPPDGEAATS